MKISRVFAVAGLVAAGTAMAGGGGSSSILFKFEGGTGNQVFRSAAGVPTLNAVAGVPSAGAPWGLSSLDAVIRPNGDIRASGEGVILLGGDGVGSRGGPRQVILSLFCKTVPVPPAVSGAVIPTPFNSVPVDLNVDGDFEVRGNLTDASGATPPLNCGDSVDNRPILLIRSVTPANPTTGTPAIPGAWFAAGFLASKHRNGHGGNR